MILSAAIALAAAPVPADYRRPASWLCHPVLAPAGCDSDQSTTEVAADGRLRPVRWSPAARPKVDCFYVYPTASHDPSLNSDLVAGEEERRVYTTQAARYRQVCRMFAPVYRQQTLAALRARLTGGAAGDEALAYGDVRAAWQDYLRHDNRGRGVLLIGHSQGARWLARLVAEEIVGRPAARQLVAAHLIGYPIAVPNGAAPAGLPVCTQARASGCLVAYSTFRAEMPPSPHAQFGHVSGGAVAACTNPAALGGGAATIDAVMPTRGMALASARAPRPWLTAGEQISSAFVTTPGLLSAQCVTRDGAQYLALTVNADPADPRTDAIDGDVAFGGRVLPDWGLHAVEMSLTLGSLVTLADAQSAAWLTRQHRPQ